MDEDLHFRDNIKSVIKSAFLLLKNITGFVSKDLVKLIQAFISCRLGALFTDLLKKTVSQIQRIQKAAARDL